MYVPEGGTQKGRPRNDHLLPLENLITHLGNSHFLKPVLATCSERETRARKPELPSKEMCTAA